MRKFLLGFICIIYIFQLQAQQADILIKNGKIINGTGNQWFYGDIAIVKNKIVAIGKLTNYTATTNIDAKGLVVAPGFIDVHTHIEGDEAKNADAKSFILDGVTTVITGNCGSSNNNIQTYFNWLDSVGLSINVASLIGHNNVRRKVMGSANRQATEQELQQMEMHIETAMKQGAVGLSTGLIYIPGTFSNSNEIVRLAKAAATYNAVYATHMRNEGDSVVQAIEEALLIGKEANIPVQISHFKVSGQQNWGRSKQTLAMVNNARKQGIEVTIDQYPYTASSTNLGTLLPDWMLADNNDSLISRIKNPNTNKEATTYMLQQLKKRKLKHFSYAVVAYHKADTTLNGKSIEAINILKGRKHTATEEVKTIFELMEKGGAGMVFHGMSESDIKYFMQYPYNMFASDAGIRAFGVGNPHPRGYGTNARILGKYVREEKVMLLEEAIRRMTSLPALKFQLPNIGLLLPQYNADIVIFDEETVQDKSTFDAPHQYSTGFKYVIVNGQLTVNNGVHTGVHAGKSIRKL